MKKFSKMLCLILSVMMILGTVGIIGYADETNPTAETAAASVKFLSDGVEIGKLPTVGKTIGAEVASTKSMALVLAAYDEANNLVCATLNKSGNYIGGLAMQSEIKKLRLLGWNSMTDMAPILDESYMLTANDAANTGALESFSVNGNAASVVGNTITAYVPVWGADGEKLSSWTVKATTKDGSGTVDLNGTTLKANEEKTMSNISSGTVKVTEGGASNDYQLKVYWQIKEDFDNNSVFDGDMTGSGTTRGQWTGSIVKGSLAKSTFTFTLNPDADQYVADYQPYIRAGVQPISSATQTDGKTQISNAGAAAASGNALRIGKSKALLNIGTGMPYFTIKNNMFSEGNTITVEYDYAVDYSKKTADSTGDIGLLGGGIRYGGIGSEVYSISDFYSSQNLPGIQNAYIKLKTNSEVSSGAYQGYWHHIKQVFNNTSKTATTYVDGKALAPGYSLADKYQSNLNLNFVTSGRRTADIWIDNLSVTWDKKPELIGMTVEGGKASVDQTNDLVTVDLPLWNTNGESFDTANASVTLTANDKIKIGDTAVESGQAADVDLSTAKKITVGSRTYDMTINRTIFDDFDTNTVFSGSVVGSATAKNSWSSESIVKGSKAKSVLVLELINGGDEYAKYQPSVSASVANISGATKQSGTGAIENSPKSKASGNALRLSKTKAKNGDSGAPRLNITGDDFKNAKSKISISYDMAFDYTKVTEGNRGLRGGGARYGGQEAAAITDNDKSSSTAFTNAKPRLWFGVQSNGSGAAPYMTLMDGSTDTWMHVDIQIDVANRKMKTTLSSKYAANNNNLERVSEVPLNGSVFTHTDGKEAKYPTWNEKLNYSFATSSWRCADIWVDNLSISYDASTTK